MKSTDSISDFFKVYEVERSSVADRLGIDNRAPQWVLDNAMQLGTHVMDPIREYFNIPYGPQSWYRCEELEKVLTWDKGFRGWCARHNKIWCERPDIIGASAWPEYFALKQHPTGKATDNEIPGIDNDALFFWIRDNLAYDQLIREFPKPNEPTSGWVHVSWAGAENRQMNFSIPYHDKYA